ncbi:AcrR family transcriptional regulator [Geomicrobium halophilum]|uniref:AcrR family transcriptional regulator n=1 Tax=Geomicrobium halophilum TaxID=549000 RepID=A0A841PQ37_9BACL|nr:TetR/AcrR family transcriptional regulator [Geomicrobium halophilum]MBB6450947.1 AcrR family transcriptional regulator [Geomicrobium halophilum]
MDGFERRREQKKQQILKSALDLFLDYGIQKVTMTEIAKQAMVSQVTIYNYFTSKHNLIHEVFIYYVEKAVKEFEEIVYSDAPFPEKINQVIFNKKEVSQQINEEFYQFIMKEYTAGADYIQTIYEEKSIPYLNHLLDEGREQGYVDRTLSNEAIFFYIAMMKDYIQREDVYKKILPLTEDITKLFFYGIVGER